MSLTARDLSSRLFESMRLSTKMGQQMRNRLLIVANLISLIAISASAQESRERMDYRDYQETVELFQSLAKNSHTHLETIGHSINYHDPQKPKYPIIALRISGKPFDESKMATDTKPAILIDGGIHPREWLASECVIELAEFLVAEAVKPGSQVATALQHVDVCLIPITTPAGRVIDDPAAGDPLKFNKTGTDPGGWRGNGDTRISPHAIDVARNFSHDWDGANGDPKEKHWRGLAPFASEEATALRQFVQNHSIGMALHIHSNSQDIVCGWDSKNRSGIAMRRKAAEVWLLGCGRMANQLMRPLDGLKLALDEGTAGVSKGQFSGWLTVPSDVKGQPDFGTVRAIQTFGLELPFDNVKHSNYYDTIFQSRSKDGTNSFHPSGATTRTLIREAFIPMALHFIEQAAAPCCMTINEKGGRKPVAASQYSVDCGLQAAKIASSATSPGVIRSVAAGAENDGVNNIPSPAYDEIDAGSYGVHTWIQNYGSKPAAASVRIVVERKMAKGMGAWSVVSTTTPKSRLLSPLTNQLLSVPIKVEGGYEYRVTLQSGVPKDEFPHNDLKVFRFLGTAK